jgi:hypothetical protein
MVRPEATPWERLFHQPLDSEFWIRIRSKAETTKPLGGILGAGSIMSSYPSPRMLYISEAWEFDENGAFSRPDPLGSGILVTVEDGDVLELWESDSGDEDRPEGDDSE